MKLISHNLITKHILFLLFLILFFNSCVNTKENPKTLEQQSNINEISGDLIIFHAGSLAIPFGEIIKEFNIEYPEINVIREIAGSRTSARKITDLNKECDVFASADYTVINELLIPEHADWNIKFATNEMAIVYNEKSIYADRITADNWYEILNEQDVFFARSDPNSDPCGYRTILTIKLAELFYNSPGLSDTLLNKDQQYIRPKETDLIALLEIGEIDYIFLYKSVAVQHNLNMLILPDEINLKNTNQEDYYNNASVFISGKEPGELITKVGAPMIYGVTIPKSSRNTEAAIAFVQFLLNKDKGLFILEKNGQPGIVPFISETYNNIPEPLMEFALPN